MFSAFIFARYRQGGKELPYRIYVPASIISGKKYPLVLFMHGAGERGNDNSKQLSRFNPIPFWQKYPCIVLAPQCPDNSGLEGAKEHAWVLTDFGATQHSMRKTPTWPMQLVIGLLNKTLIKYPIDDSRVYVTGLSMGGFATWELLQRMPARTFAAAVPICGGADMTVAPTFVDLPLWVFHGSDDTIVLTQRSRDIVNSIRRSGGKPRYTEYPGAGHDVWTRAYQDTAMWSWLFAQHLKAKKLPAHR